MRTINPCRLTSATSSMALRNALAKSNATAHLAGAMIRCCNESSNGCIKCRSLGHVTKAIRRHSANASQRFAPSVSRCASTNVAPIGTTVQAGNAPRNSSNGLAGNGNRKGGWNDEHEQWTDGQPVSAAEYRYHRSEERRVG